MTSLILVCVFGVAPGSPGTVKSHPLTGRQIARLEQAWRADEADAERPVRLKLCREVFGESPDLSWTEERPAIQAVRL